MWVSANPMGELGRLQSVESRQTRGTGPLRTHQAPAGISCLLQYSIDRANWQEVLAGGLPPRLDQSLRTSGS